MFAYNQTTEVVTHKFQIFLVGFPDLISLVKQSDMHPASVVWTSTDLLFTPASASAYRSMINVMTKTQLSRQDPYRLEKYWNHGFSLVVEREPTHIQEGPLGGLSSSGTFSPYQLLVGPCQFTIVMARKEVLIVDTISSKNTQQSTTVVAPQPLRYKRVGRTPNDQKELSDLSRILKRIQKHNDEKECKQPIYYKHTTVIGLQEEGSMVTNYENGAQIKLLISQNQTSLAFNST